MKSNFKHLKQSYVLLKETNTIQNNASFITTRVTGKEQINTVQISAKTKFATMTANSLTIEWNNCKIF